MLAGRRGALGLDRVALPVLVVVQAPRLVLGLRQHKRVVGWVAGGEPEGQQVLAQRREQRDGPSAVLAGLAAGDDAAVDVLLGVHDPFRTDPCVRQRKRVLRSRAGVGDELGEHPLTGMARAIAQRPEQRLDLLDAEGVDNRGSLRGGLAHRADRVDRQLALADRVGADRLQDGERLAHGRRSEPVGLERLAQRLHGRRRELTQLEVPDAREQVAVPDLRVGGEGVAGQPPAGVVRPPVVLDELAEDDATATELVQRSAAPGEA